MVFDEVCKEIGIFFSFALLRLVIGQKPHANFSFNRKLNQNQEWTCSYTFSRASRPPHVTSPRFDWLTGFSASFVIGQHDYSSFGFTILNWKLFRMMSLLELSIFVSWQKHMTTKLNLVVRDPRVLVQNVLLETRN